MRGGTPRTREGRRPDRPKLQWLVVSGQRRRFRCRRLERELTADWPLPEERVVCPHFGIHFSGILKFNVATKPCSVYVLCAVCLGRMYRQCFCSGLSMVKAVNVGDIWELLRLSCLRWHIFGTCQDAGWGDVLAAAGRQLRIALTLAAARGCRTGGVAGAEPPHKGGPKARPPKRRVRREKTSLASYGFAHRIRLSRGNSTVKRQRHLLDFCCLH